MSKRKKSVPQHLNKNERNGLQWELSIPAACQNFEVVEAAQPTDDRVSATPSTSQVSSKISPYTEISATLVIHASVSQPAHATLLYLGSVPLAVVTPIESVKINWSDYNEVVLTVNNTSKLASIQCGDSVFPVSFGDFDVTVIRWLREQCFCLKLDPIGDLGVQMSVYLSVVKERQTTISKGVMRVLTQFFPNAKVLFGALTARTAGSSRHDMAALYGAVTRHHLHQLIDTELPVQPPCLRPSLRKYQRQALRWMLTREGPAQPLASQLSGWVKLESPSFPHGFPPSEIKPDSPCPLFLDRLNGTLSWSLPPLPPLPSGGILADEMGLGKTVEVLGLVLSNPRPHDHRLLASNQSGKSGEAEGDRNSSEVISGAENNVTLVQKADMDEGRTEGEAQVVLEVKCEDVQDAKLELPVNHSEDRGPVDKEMKDIEEFFEPEKEEKIEVGKKGRKRRRKRKAEASVAEPKKKKVNLLREAANQWYQDQLASTKRPSPSAHSEEKALASSKTLKCLCGTRSLAGEIQCQNCLTWQHCECMGVPQGSLPKTYFCPQCWQHKETIPSGASLIISPSSICRQWETEVTKHISDPAFSLLVYTGVSSSRYMQPTQLATQTVVLMTYETLCKELDFADLNPANTLRLRHAKRYVAPPSPLLCVDWWRVCLDEAQMAQSVGSKAFSMAQRLHAEHRWAVTGTPVTKSVSDLHGTLQFLGLPTLADPRSWRGLISGPLSLGDHSPLDALAPLIWRTAKADVADQINLPKQSEKLHWVTFSPVEEFFYQRQQEAAEAAFLHGLDRVCGDEDADHVRLGSLDRHSMARVLAPLLRLRQACTHPGVARGNNISFQGSALTMEELLESLIKKAVVDCEDALRLQIAALNGLGAVETIRGRPSAAASSYRTVLSLATEHEGTLSVDRLQLIHATHNLADLLDAVGAGTAGIPHTLRDHTLREESAEMERQYMRRHHAQVQTSATALAELTAQVANFELVLSSGANSWWRALALALAARGDGTELSSRLDDAFADANNGGLKASKKAQRTLCSSVHVMIGELGRWVAGCEESRDIALAALDSLRAGAADPDTVATAVTCHIRAGNAQHDRKQRNKCLVCRCETQLKAYESLLFTMSAEHNKHELIGDVVILGQLTQGTWQASAHEIALKTLLALGRSRREVDRWLGAGATHLKMLDAAKKEFRRARALWTNVRDEIAARDELGLCRTKLRLRLPGEVVDKTTRDDQLASLHIIEPHEVEVTHERLGSELVVAVDDLRKKRGQLGYLTTLRKRTDLETNPDPCPICQLAVGNKWSVLPCGHLYCLDCLLLLGRRRRHVRCAVCREEAPLSRVTHVSLAPPSSEVDPPSSEALPPSSEVDPPSSEVLPPSSEVDPPSSEALPPSSEVDPPSSEALPPSSEVDPPPSGAVVPTVDKAPPTFNVTIVSDVQHPALPSSNAAPASTFVALPTADLVLPTPALSLPTSQTLGVAGKTTDFVENVRGAISEDTDTEVECSLARSEIRTVPADTMDFTDEAAENISESEILTCETACTTNGVESLHGPLVNTVEAPGVAGNFASATSENIETTLQAKGLLEKFDEKKSETCSSVDETSREANNIPNTSSEAGVKISQTPVLEVLSGEPSEAACADVNESTPTETEGAKTATLRVRGSHSAKVSAVVRCLLGLRAADASVKVLVFSAWDKVLDILEVALQQNSILFKRLKSGKQFQSRLDAFKTQSRPTALLLPLRSGSKGLNLTEATHLVFVEPVLEPEFELQALGRIHRIGQTRETMIHRFLVHGSLEERIHAAVRADTASWHDDKVTLGQLRRLFSVSDEPRESQDSQPLECSEMADC